MAGAVPQLEAVDPGSHLGVLDPDPDPARQGGRALRQPRAAGRSKGGSRGGAAGRGGGSGRGGAKHKVAGGPARTPLLPACLPLTPLLSSCLLLMITLASATALAYGRAVILRSARA